MPRSKELENQNAVPTREAGAGLVGRFRYDAVGDTWHWDEATSFLHGLEARRRSIGTEALLDLVEPEDRPGLLATTQEQARSRFRIGYRVLDSEGPRHLLVVGHPVPAPRSAEGHIVDITADLRGASEPAARAAVEGALEGRSAIEQAKGALMLAYGLSQDQAFGLMRWWSRSRNVRIRVLAERLMATAHEGTYSHDGLRGAFDRILHDLTSDTAAND